MWFDECWTRADPPAAARHDAGMKPPIIPYVDQHDGPKRALDLTCRRGLVSGAGVEVSIDGRAYPVAWGTSLFEVPADRPVSVGVMQTLKGGVGHAHVVLTPEEPPVLEYRGPAQLSRRGELGLPGTTRSNGLGCQVALLAVLVVLLLVVLAIPVLLFAP